MTKYTWYLLIVALAVLVFSTCSDPLVVGAELFEEDRANVGFNDTLSIVSGTVRGDSVRAYSPFVSEQLINYRFGRFADPVFGMTEVAIYAQPRLERIKPDFEGAELDSIVLVLPYDSAGIYGRVDDPFGLEVFRVTEDMPRESEYFSNQSFQTEAMPLGAVDFEPSFDSLEVVRWSNGNADTISFRHLRVPLDPALGEELLSYDTLITADDTTFLEQFKGIHIRPTQSTFGLLSFNLLTSVEGGVVLYYRDSDGEANQFRFQFTALSTRLNTYEHDYTGSRVEPVLEAPADNDSLFFVQGLAGVNGRLEIPALNTLEGVIVNNAELEITAADLEEDNPLVFERVQQLLLYVDVGEDGLQPITDLGIVVSRGVSVPGFFGGAPEDPGNGAPVIYRFNITAHLQRMIDGENSNVLYLLAGKFTNELTNVVPFKAANPWRSVLYGGNHPQYPVRLKVAYTQQQQ